MRELKITKTPFLDVSAHLKASPNDTTSKAKTTRLCSPLPCAERYGANIRFGTSTNLSPDAFSTDSENFNFLLSIEVTFGSRSDIFLKSSVRNFRNPLKIGSFVQEHSVNFGK